MTPISPNQCSFLLGLLEQGHLQRAESAAPAQGNLQGRHVQARPHAQHITPSPPEQAAPPATSALEQRQARPAKSVPTLVRQARYGGLSSSTQLQLSSGSSGKVAQGKGLFSINQVIASGGPAKSDSLLERFLNLFRSDKSSAHYRNILTGLQAYHDACQTGTAQNAKTRLDELSKVVGRYSQGSDVNSQRTETIEALGMLIGKEQVTLGKLATELNGGALLPQGATLSHALAFIREGVSLKEMAGLIDKGLKLDRAGPKIAADEKPSTADKQPPPGYLRLLANLEKYHVAGAAHATDAGAQRDIDVAKQAMNMLQNLSASTASYLTNKLYLLAPKDKNGNLVLDPHTQAIQDLSHQIPMERKVLSGLLSELRRGRTLPEGADLSHALAFAREGVSLLDMDRLMTKGLQPSQATDARMVLDSERGTLMMDDLNSRTPEQRAHITRDFNEGEHLLLLLSGLGIQGGREYRRLGIPITHQTIVTEHTDEHLLSAMSPINSGAFNTVYKARYNGPDGIANGAFKPLSNTERGWVAQAIGIDLDRPQIANRNLATQDVARALGFDVVVSCQIGTRQEPKTQKLQIGLVMGRAPGKTAHDTPREHYANPEVRREITKLQLLDHLVGQGDRHGGNYFIDMHKDEEGQTKVKVSGIDNDQCFGKNTRHGNDICYVNNPEGRGYRGTEMPPLIDTDMAAAIRSITPEQLSALLNDKLNPAEVEATLMRLQSLHEHVSFLEKEQQVITPTEWNNHADLSSLHKAHNSYFARDEAHSKVTF